MVVGEVNLETDVVVIGGGPGGYVAAIRAAELGLATVLVERAERPGSLCLHHGCIPSKALLAAADLAYRARNAAAMGLRVPEVAVDMQALRDWQRGIVDRLARGVATLLDKHGVTVVRGEGVLAAQDRVAVATPDGSVRYTARRGIVIATGARPQPVAVLRANGGRVLSATNAVKAKLINLWVVFDTIRMNGGISRSGIADETGLSKQASFDLVVHAVGIVRTGAFTNAKELHQLSLEPQPGGRRGEQRKVLRKAAPDGPSIRLDGRAIARGHTQVLH